MGRSGLPGELLEILMIIKMPFDVPTEPIVKAYGGLIESQGGNSFMDSGFWILDPGLISRSSRTNVKRLKTS